MTTNNLIDMRGIPFSMTIRRGEPMASIHSHTRLWRMELRDLVNNNRAAFERLIKRQRADLRWSLRDVAARCNLSHEYIRDIENGEYLGISVFTINELMDVYALNISDLRAEIAAMHDEEQAAD
jgi:ribosome-binding protein aMBF1 (putative translation factor)